MNLSHSHIFILSPTSPLTNINIGSFQQEQFMRSPEVKTQLGDMSDT